MPEKTKDQKKEISADALSEALKGLREQLKLSKRAFAASLGVSDVQIGRLERGVSKLSEQFLEKVKEVYGTDLKTDASADTVLYSANEKNEAIKEEGKEEKKKLTEAVKKPVVEKPEETKPADTAKAPKVYIQSLMGGTIGVEEILGRLSSEEVDTVYVKPEENRAYWVGKNASGAIELW